MFLHKRFFLLQVADRVRSQWQHLRYLILMRINGVNFLTFPVSGCLYSTQPQTRISLASVDSAKMQRKDSLMLQRPLTSRKVEHWFNYRQIIFKSGLWGWLEGGVLFKSWQWLLHTLHGWEWQNAADFTLSYQKMNIEKW